MTRAKKIAVYPGTFDPFTKGHVDLVERALHLFDEIIVAVAENQEKKPLFTLAERVKMAQEVLAAHPTVRVLGFKSLLTAFAEEHGAKVILRGLRAVSDFDYEFQLASMNRRLAPEIESVFLMPAEQYGYISSRLVREIHTLGGEVKDFVPEIVYNELHHKLRR